MPTTHTGSSPKQYGACGIRKEAESVITPVQQGFKAQVSFIMQKLFKFRVTKEILFEQKFAIENVFSLVPMSELNSTIAQIATRKTFVRQRSGSVAP